MAFQSKAEQREASSTNYSSAKSTLQSNSVKEQSMGNNGPDKVWGKVVSNGSSKKITGKIQTREATSNLSGKMTGASYSGGKKGK